MTSYYLEIYGRTWSGAKTVYQYPLTAERAKILATNSDDPERDAGDFSEVIDYRVVEETCIYEQPRHGVSRRTDTFKTLRGFRNGMTPSRFYYLANA